MSAGEYEVSRALTEEDGDCRLRTLERSFRRKRCGIIVGIDVGHEKGILGLGYCEPKSLREVFLMVDGRSAAEAGEDADRVPPQLAVDAGLWA